MQDLVGNNNNNNIANCIFYLTNTSAVSFVFQFAIQKFKDQDI